MPTSFANPPLVEIVAELRWNPASAALPIRQVGGAQAQTGAQVAVWAPDSLHEQFFMRLGGALYALEHRQVERLVPPDFPVMIGQPVYRYKRQPENAEVEKVATLFQAGVGLFTANALPPYKSWHEFSSTVSNGIRALLEARVDKEKDQPFSQVSLRYIDAFGPTLTKGLTPSDFIESILGFKINLPSAVTDVVSDTDRIKAGIQLQIPIHGDMQMAIRIGEALVKSEPAILFDTTVISTSGLVAEHDVIMEKLNSAHDVIHRMFIGITSQIHDEMKPSKEASNVRH